MSEIYPGGDAQYSNNLGLALWGADEVVVENFLLIDAAIGSGSSVRINGSVISNPNFINSATVTFSVVGSNVSATAASPGGVTGDIQFNNGSGGFGGSTFLWSAANNQLTDVVGSTSITLGNVFPLSSIAGFSVGTPFSGGAGAALFYEPGATVGISIADGAGDVISSNIVGGVPNFLVENTSGLLIKIQPGMISGSAGALLALDNSNYTPDGFFLSDDIVGNYITGGVSVGGIDIISRKSSLTLGSDGTFTLQNGSSAIVESDASDNLTIGGESILLNPSTGVIIPSSTYLNIGGPLWDGTSSPGVAGYVLSSTGTEVKWIAASATGVTSVSFTGGIISVATATTTPALTVAGTSGGIPYFSSTTTWASSALLAAGGVVLGGGAGTTPATNTQLVFSASTLAVGLAGAGTGILALKGTTSGVVSITGQAAAGTYNFNLPITAGSAGQVLTSQAGGATAMTWTTPTTGTVTSVSFTGGLISVATATTTPALTVAGTSGGIPYFSSASTWASSALLTANSPVLGGGAGTTPATATFLTTDGTKTLTIGVAGGGSGVLALAGTTSGTATITAPAVAGTATNPIAFSNMITVPNGSDTAPSYAFAGGATTGFSLPGNGVIDVSSAGQLAYRLAGNIAIFNQTNGGLNVASGGLGTTDVSITRVASSTFGVGNGTSGDITGSLQCASIALNGAVASPTAGVYYSGTNAGITQSAIAVGTIGTTGGIVTTFTGVSDERLKKFTEYGGGLAEILNIVPIRYRWNEAGQKKSGQTGDRDYVGFSAQNVQKSIPEAIQGTEGEEKYLSFDDRPVIAALCNAVKGLSAKNDALEARLAHLEKIIEKEGA
jgi:hypothetical protein